MKIYFLSLGCDKNTVDSEVMLGVLSDAGHSFTDDENEAEAAIINSCCFIGDAKEESIDHVIRLGGLKESGSLRFLILAGCLAGRYHDEIHKELPEVDAIVTPGEYLSIAGVLDDLLSGKDADRIGDMNAPVQGNKKRIISTEGYYEYLKIAEGCNKRCTYCIIPQIKGSYRSVPMEDLIAEARMLAGSGVKELNIVAQETTLYGTDLYGKKMLPELLKELCKIDGIEWIRLLYCYPEEITDELIETIKNEKKILHYIDMPIQSGSDRILKLMGRATDTSSVRDVVGRLRKNIPDICIRTTMITGFPSETDKDHEETIELIGEIGFDRLGVFTYSEEEGTKAALMEEKVPESVMINRWNDIMALQQEISYDRASGMKDKVLDVLVCGYLPEDGVYVGRTYRDANDIDGYVFVDSPVELLSGDMIKVKITGFSDYDLTGEYINEE